MKYNIDYNNFGKFWTKNEINILKRNFHILPIEKIMKILPGRTKAGIMGEAYNVLKLYSPCISKHFKGDYSNNPYKTLSEAERAYIAGIIDGEGCISTYFTKRFCIRLFIVNTHYPMLNWLHSKLPGSCIYKYRKKRKIHHKERYSFSLNSLYTFHLLTLIYPFLIIKRKKAEFIIDLFNNLARGISWREQINKNMIKIPK